MAQYELGRDHFLHHRTRDGVEPRLHTKGEKVNWDGPPSMSMIPLDAAANKAKEATDAERGSRHEKLRATAGAPRVGWTPQVEASFMKSLKSETTDPQIDARS